MQIIIYDNAQQVAENAALWVIELIKRKANPVLGLATGSTPICLYRQLVEQYKKGAISFKNVTTFNLDEYHQIDAENPQSYRSFMNKNLFRQVDIDLNKTFLPSCGINQNPRTQGLEYENKITQHGGIDLQILGIGANGHIGFNEPTSSLSSRTRIKTLTQQTIQDNSRLFKADEQQPCMAMTMGIGTILDARYVMLLATGKNKAKAVKDMISGSVSAMCPASALQMHENAIVLLDKSAACELDDQNYFKWVNDENLKVIEDYGYFHNF